MLNKEKVSLGIAPIGWTNDDVRILEKRIHLNRQSVRWHWQDSQDQK